MRLGAWLAWVPIAMVLAGPFMKDVQAAPATVMRQTLLPPGPDNPRNSDGTFVRLKDGRILLVYSRFTGTEGADESPCYLAGRYSSDGGKTWTPHETLIVSNDEAEARNVISPSLLRLSDGSIVLFYLRRNGWLDMRPVMRVSTDEARTWGEPRFCVGDDDLGYYILNNDRAVQLASGRIVLPLADHYDPASPEHFTHYPRTLCYLSDDLGKTWRRSRTVLTGIPDAGNRVALQEPGVVELKDGRLLMFCRTHTGYVYRSFSSDGGDIWTPHEKYAGLFAPVSAPAIERIPRTGDLLLVWNNHEGIATNAASPYHGKRTPYNVAISRDEGGTWENVKTLEDDPDGWYCYTGIEFVDNDVMLSHCAGNRPKDGGLAVTQITRFPLSFVYDGPPRASSPVFVEGRRLKIFVLTGQSNSLGTTEDLSEEDITPGHDPLDAQIPFFWANRSSRAGEGCAPLYGDSGGKIVTLCAQQGEGSNPLFWGPEIGFGRTLATAGMTDLMIVKASRGGGGNSFWLKGDGDDHMYRHVVETVLQAVQALPPGTDFEISALLYVQGESDDTVEAEAAGERLRALAGHLRQDLPRADGIRVLIGGIALGGKNQDIVRAQQSALPSLEAACRYVDTLDLSAQRYDNLHFNKSAKLELGRRLARAWLEWD